MRILLVTPLYPPDIAEPAPYVKELAKRLKGDHEITVLAYNHIPESVNGVRIVSIEKSSILPIRLFRFFYLLLKEVNDTDSVYVQNGPSVELPLLLASFFFRVPTYFRLGDETALRNTTTHPLFRQLLTLVLNRVNGVITHGKTSPLLPEILTHIKGSIVHDMERPLTRPEILPLHAYPKEAFAEYEASWNMHVTKLTHLFSL